MNNSNFFLELEVGRGCSLPREPSPINVWVKKEPFLPSLPIPPRPSGERRRDSLTWQLSSHVDLIAYGWFTMSGLCLLGSLKRWTFQEMWRTHGVCFPECSFGVWNRDSIRRLDKAGEKEQSQGWRELLCLISLGKFYRIFPNSHFWW